MQAIIARYAPKLDEVLRATVQEHLIDTEGFGVMLRYAMGWSDAQDHPYQRPTGKRLRPILLLLTCEATGSNWHEALPAAAAVELLHNFSLIHDDIQDGSETRHNRPTVWKIWGTANAINAGDAMFTLAYSALADLSLSPELTMLVWKKFNRTNIELTRGQHMDMRFETLERVSMEEYVTMISGKSAALLAACAYIGALIGSKNHQIAEQLATFGLNIGIAFQIHDDILGIWGDPTVTGKSVHTDIVSRKKSMPVLFGLEQSAELRQLYAKPTFDDSDVRHAVELLQSVGADAYARQQEAVYYQLGIDALTQAGLAGHKDITALLDFLFSRTY